MNIGELRRISANEELSLNFVAKDEMVSKALFQLQGFEGIVLKGGTAINRAYLKKKRFSEDIDFDLVFSGSAKEALEKIGEIVKNLQDFKIAKPRIMKGIIRYDLFYQNPLDHQDKIRLEFKVIKKAHGFEKKIVNFGFVPTEPALLNVYTLEVLIRHKIECVLNRLEGKDFFDLFYLLDLSHQLKVSKSEKNRLIGRISLEENKIRLVANAVNHYIPRGIRPDWDMFLEELKKKVEKVF